MTVTNLMNDNPTIKDEVLSHPRVILGLLREAHFLRANALLSIGDGDYTGRFIQLAEKDARSIDEERTLEFEVDFTTSRLIRSAGKARLSFPKFVATFDFSSFQISGNRLTIAVPTLIGIKQHRTVMRAKLANLPFQAILYTDDSISEVAIKLRDISNTGVGCYLKTFSKSEPRIGGLLQGNYYIDRNELRICAKIVRLKEVPPLALDGYKYYDCGLESIRPPAAASVPPPKVESRAIFRFSVDESIELENHAIASTPILFSLKEASFLGFSGTLKKPQNAVLPVGLHYKVLNSTLEFRLVEEENLNFRFVLADGSQEDRLKWAKQITRATFPDVDTNTTDAESLLRLFCDAGALPPELVERGSLYNNEFLIPLGQESDQSFWVFRWINLNNSEKGAPIRGHMSGIRFGDNAWFVGDTVGGITPESKIDPTFVPRFFSSFKDFSLAQNPCPRTFFVWKRGHPYWKPFEDHIFSESNKKLLYSWIKISHTKISHLSCSEISPKFRERFISHREHDLIEEVVAELKSQGTEGFAKAFDFTADRFESPLLRTQFLNNANSVFKRRYALFERDNDRYFVIYSRLPFGSSFNQVMTSAFVFNLAPNDDIVSDWETLKNQVLALGIKNGTTPSSIRRIIGSTHKEVLLSGESNFVDGFLIHPSLIGFFDGWRNSK